MPALCWPDRADRHTHARAYVATGIPPVALQWRDGQPSAHVRCACEIEKFFASVRQPYVAPPTGSSRYQISMRNASCRQSNKSHPSPGFPPSRPALPVSGPRATAHACVRCIRRALRCRLLRRLTRTDRPSDPTQQEEAIQRHVGPHRPACLPPFLCIRGHSGVAE